MYVFIFPSNWGTLPRNTEFLSIRTQSGGMQSKNLSNFWIKLLLCAEKVVF
jgi:hypothetical protein